MNEENPTKLIEEVRRTLSEQYSKVKDTYELLMALSIPTNPEGHEYVELMAALFHLGQSANQLGRLERVLVKKLIQEIPLTPQGIVGTNLWGYPYVF